MTVYGDLDTSTLSELPKGRSPISTTVVPAAERPAWLDRAWRRVHEEVAAGHQVYVVCPKIGDDLEPRASLKKESSGGDANGDPDDFDEDDPGNPDEKRPPLAVLEMAESLSAGPLAGLRLAVLHGRMPSPEKDATMTAFAAGQIDVL